MRAKAVSFLLLLAAIASGCGGGSGLPGGPSGTLNMAGKWRFSFTASSVCGLPSQYRTRSYNTTITQDSSGNFVGTLTGAPAPALTGNNGGVRGTVTGNRVDVFFTTSEVIGNLEEGSIGQGQGTSSGGTVSGTFLGQVVIVTVQGFDAGFPLCTAADHRFTMTRT